MSFVERHGLWNAGQRAAAKQMLETVDGEGIKAIRFSFADQHGILRGKTIAVGALTAALENGVAITTTLLLKDTSHRTVYPAFTPGSGIGMPEMEGAADFLIFADPTTFRVLPWAPETAWVLCDMYFASGKPVPFDTRRLLRQALAKLGKAGYDFLAGLEIEFHVFKLTDPHLQPSDAGQPGTPPEVSLLTTGYQYLTEDRYDQIDPVVQLLRTGLEKLQLPLRSFEVEFGPSQFEFTLDAMRGMGSADAMLLFRAAVKQIARRNGYHATFMCRPKLPNVMSSGWHLHQSLVSVSNKRNAFVPSKKDQLLSEIGKHYLAGEPAANPYLYFASQIHAGLDGIARKLEPGPSADTPYEAKVEHLPSTLSQALSFLKEDKVMRESFGAEFIDYYCHIKEAEIDRFNLEVSEWEHREYFDLL